MRTAAVFVTGATGFVGSALVARLAARGVRVHALVRPSSSRAALAGLPLRWHEGDVTDAAAVERALGACRAELGASAPLDLVHSAALISYRTRDRARSWTVNVEGTRHVLAAALAARVARLCFVSSVVAVGTVPRGRAANDEESPFADGRLRSAYVQSKRAAEELVLAARDRLDVVVVNPGAIFGPAQVPSNSARFLRSLAGGRFPVPAPPGSLSVVGLDDVAAGIELALERGVRGRRYLLTESNWTLPALMELVFAELGARPRVRRLPRWLWRALVGFARGIDRVRPFAWAAPDGLELLAEDYRFDASRARRELGWSPRPFREALRGALARVSAEPER